MSLRPEFTLERLNERSAGRLPGLVGYRAMALEQGLLVAELDIRPELLAPNGYLHAATVIALADTACGYACLAHLPQGADNFTTIELEGQFPRHCARRNADVHCEARASRPHDAGLGRDCLAPR